MRRRAVVQGVVRACLVATGAATMLASPAGAQRPFQSLLEDLREREYGDVRGHLMAAAEGTPEDTYGFTFGEDLRSFGEELLPAAAVNFRQCGLASGGDRPDEVDPVPGPSDKDTVVEHLRRSLMLCDEALADITPAQALEPTFGRYVRGSHLIAMVGHCSHVYGKITLMMRVNGLMPPSSG